MSSINLANIFNLTNVEFGLAVVEGSILFSLLVLILYVKRALKRPAAATSLPDATLSFRELAKESESLCADFSRILDEKREIARRLTEQLDAKIEALNLMLKKTDESGLPGSKESRGKAPEAEIVQMNDAGCSISDISRRLRISQGEVQLVVDMKRHGL
jgi:hypothetical protein